MSPNFDEPLSSRPRNIALGVVLVALAILVGSFFLANGKSDGQKCADIVASGTQAASLWFTAHCR